MKTIAIIGGGPAGAMTAHTLASRRAAEPGVMAEALARNRPDFSRVLVFEEKPGWEKPCGGGLPYRALRRYPFLLHAPEEHVCIRSAELVAANDDAVRLRLREPLAVYSRSVLNSLLLRGAQEAGAEVVEDRILGLRREGEGWRLEGRRGNYDADYLVLAAGARSRLRGLLAAHLGARDFMLTFGYYTPGADRLLRVQFFDDFEGYAWCFPRPDHLDIGICGKVGESNMAGLRGRLHAFMRKFDYASDSATVYSHLLPALTPESWNNLKLGGPGWALAGDAGGLVDPITGEGIYFAMRSGELLAESLLAGSPESYPERVWCDFGRKLALGARLARYFYHEDFLGELSSTRLVQFAARSPTFMDLVQDLLSGAQSYAGLARRLYGTLGKAWIEIGLASASEALKQISVARRPLFVARGGPTAQVSVGDRPTTGH